MQLCTASISQPGSRTFLCDLPFPARTTELRYKCLLFSSSWVLLFSLSLAFILSPAGCSSLFIYWLFSMEKHPVFQHWQQIRVMSLPITLHWVSSLPVRLLAAFLMYLTILKVWEFWLWVVILQFLLTLAKSFVMHLSTHDSF